MWNADVTGCCIICCMGINRVLFVLAGMKIRIVFFSFFNSIISSGKNSAGVKSISKKRSKNSSLSDTAKAKTKGKITSKELKSIKGKDENLQASGKISDSVSYTLTINGEDVKLTKDWTYKLQSDCKYKDDIEQLAVKPLILCTEGSGTFPGQMLVTSACKDFAF